jgi:ketosteroid isomerase-like protein
MAAADEQVVRRLFEGFSAGAKLTGDERLRLRQQLAARILTEDAVYREDPRWPGAGVYEGREAVIRCWTGYLDVFDDPVLEVTTTESIGDRVMACVAFRSGVGEMPVEHTWGYVLEVEGGLVRQLDAYLDPEAARAACHTA